MTSVGQTVYLYCGVHNLGERAVSNCFTKLTKHFHLYVIWYIVRRIYHESDDPKERGCPVRHIQNPHLASIGFNPFLLLSVASHLFWTFLVTVECILCCKLWKGQNRQKVLAFVWPPSFWAKPRFWKRLTSQSQSVAVADVNVDEKQLNQRLLFRFPGSDQGI